MALPGERLSQRGRQPDRGRPRGGRGVHARRPRRGRGAGPTADVADGRSRRGSTADEAAPPSPSRRSWTRPWPRPRRGVARGRGQRRGRPRASADAGPSTSTPDDGRGRRGRSRTRRRRRGPRTTPFGSVWDSQLGTPPPPVASLAPLGDDDEDFDEPEIPEYLIAEQRRGAIAAVARGGGRSWRPRGGRSAYQSAIDRERYGRGGGGGDQPLPRRQRPDRRARISGAAVVGYDRVATTRPRVRRPRRDPASTEPWSEVPPELEAMLRAQVGAASRRRRRPTSHAPVDEAEADRRLGTERRRDRPPPRRRAPKRRTTRKAAPATATDAATRRHREAAADRRRSAATTTRKAAAAGREPDGDRRPPRPMPPGRGTRAKATGDGRKTAAATADDAAMPRATGQAAPKRRDAPARRRRPDRDRLTDAVDGARTRGHPAALAAVGAMIRGGRRTRSCSSVRPASARRRSRSTSRLACCARPRTPAARPCGACRACRLVASRRPPGRASPRARRPGSPGRHRWSRAQGPRHPRPRRRTGAAAGRGRRPRGDHRVRPPHERGRPGRPAQDPRGAAGRRHDRPLRRCRGAAAADHPVALRADPPRAGRGPRHRGDPRRARASPTPPLAARLARIAGGRPGIALAWARAAGRAARPRRARSGRCSTCSIARPAERLAGDPGTGRPGVAALAGIGDGRRSAPAANRRSPPAGRGRGRARARSSGVDRDRGSGRRRHDRRRRRREADDAGPTQGPRVRAPTRGGGPRSGCGPTSPATSPCASADWTGPSATSVLLDETQAARGRASSRRPSPPSSTARSGRACCSPATCRRNWSSTTSPSPGRAPPRSVARRRDRPRLEPARRHRPWPRPGRRLPLLRPARARWSSS